MKLKTRNAKMDKVSYQYKRWIMKRKQKLMYNAQIQKLKGIKYKINAHRATGVAVPSVQNQFLKASVSFRPFHTTRIM